MKSVYQTTIADSVVFSGVGVHSGQPALLTLHPAEAGTGVLFRRTGLESGREASIPASHRMVGATELCTVIGDPASASVATIEHLVAALAGLGVDNVIAEIDGPEVPILDGSAKAFVEGIDAVGLVRLGASRRYIKVLKPVRVDHGRAFGEFRPGGNGFRLEVEIDFPTALIGRQRIALDLTPRAFRRELAAARTFGFLKDVERLWSAGFALGASTENTVVLGDDRVLNTEGLRFADEFVRHKALDALGDLALAELPIMGTYRSFCGGHKVNGAAVRALLSDRSAFAVVEAAPAREVGHAGMPAELQFAYAPDTH